MQPTESLGYGQYQQTLEIVQALQTNIPIDLTKIIILDFLVTSNMEKKLEEHRQIKYVHGRVSFLRAWQKQEFLL